MPNYVPTTTGGGGDDFETIVIAVAVIAVIGAIFVFIFIVVRMGKSSYTKPQVSMETLGIKRGLTAVEASYLLDMKPPQLVTEMLYSLLQKRAVGPRKLNPASNSNCYHPTRTRRAPKKILCGSTKLTS